MPGLASYRQGQDEARSLTWGAVILGCCGWESGGGAQTLPWSNLLGPVGGEVCVTTSRKYQGHEVRPRATCLFSSLCQGGGGEGIVIT